MSLGLKGCRGWGPGLCMACLWHRPPAPTPMALLQGAGVAGGLVPLVLEEFRLNWNYLPHNFPGNQR